MGAGKVDYSGVWSEVTRCWCACGCKGLKGRTLLQRCGTGLLQEFLTVRNGDIGVSAFALPTNMHKLVTHGMTKQTVIVIHSYLLIPVCRTEVHHIEDCMQLLCQHQGQRFCGAVTL